MFERSLELASELGLISGPIEQILDSTPMLGAAAVQDTATLVRAAVRKLIDAVRRPISERRPGLVAGFGLTTPGPRVKPEGDWQDKDSRTALLIEVARDAARALQAIEHDQTLIAEERVAEAVKVLREIIGQEFDVDHLTLRGVRGPAGLAQIASAHDPEMRHGRKTPSRQFTGYKLHAAVAVDVPIVTAISLSPGNEHDGQHASALVDQQPERRRPGG